MIAYLSLGSNLGDRARHVEEALECLEDEKVHVARRSSVYETEPQEFLNQPWFLNMVAEVETSLSPHELLSRILDIETRLGRIRLTPKGPRIIDIDILLYGTLVVDTRELQIPHPRLGERRFVLEPLAELAPQFRDLLERLEGQITRKYESSKKEPDAGQASG